VGRECQRYAMYMRYFNEGEFKGLRSIGVSHSTDFRTWSEPIGLTYPNSPPQQMYTNQIAPYYRAPHLLLDGFVSLHAPLSGGELTTMPVKFTGQRLSLNYATSAVGNLRVEIQDSAGTPLSGFSLADADELFGDAVDQTAAWKNSTDVSRLAGQEVRLHFVLQDGYLFLFQFTDWGITTSWRWLVRSSADRGQ
jgi:hypothetical protein